MEFDSKKFLKEKFTDRTGSVSVPDMVAWFSGKGKPAFTVRGLTGKEVGIARVAAARNKSVEGILKMLKDAKVSEQVDALKSVFDMDLSGATEETAIRIEYFKIGRASCRERV